MAKKPDAAALLAALQGPSADDDEPPARVPPQLKAVPSLSAPEPHRQVPEEGRVEGPGATPRAPQAVSQPAAGPVTRSVKAPSRGKAKTPRSELKHIGGYLDDETVEKVALLRIRLKLENSELLKLAIDDLFRKHAAKRAFGDA